MDFDNPTAVYTAKTNVESHLVVEMLRSHGIEALAVEDQSGVSLWSFGTLSQYHKPKVWVDAPNEAKALELVREFEAANKQDEGEQAGDEAGSIVAACEECKKEFTFAANLDGTTQVCAECGAYIDVGELDWDEDFGEPVD